MFGWRLQNLFAFLANWNLIDFDISVWFYLKLIIDCVPSDFSVEGTKLMSLSAVVVVF